MKRILIIIAVLISLTPALSLEKVYVITIAGGIGPGVSSYIATGIKLATEENAQALIIRLNTPGGLLESTRDIVKHILEAEVPVIVYVGPGGSRAGSAGVFITLAGHVAAMAPGTNIGAAHPVGLGGQSDSSAMFDKITNDAAAFVRTIAQKRNRNEAWAERAVRESISATENEACDEGVIDIISPSVDSLLKQVDGWVIEFDTHEHKLKTANAEIIEVEMNWKEELLTILTDPNIAYIFVMLAIYGIMFELYNPGSIFPGVIGGISAVLAGYSLQILPINYAGLALIILSIILFIIEVKVPSYGLLTVGGVLSLFLGSIMLIDSPFEFMSISMGIIITSVVLTSLFFIVIIGFGLRAQKRKKASGSEALVGETGVAITDLGPGKKGKVRTHGEIWQAESSLEIKEGTDVVVTAVKNFVLQVKAE